MASYFIPSYTKDKKPVQTVAMAMFLIIILQQIAPVVGRLISTLFTTYFLLVIVVAEWGYFLNWKSAKWINTLMPLIIVAAIGLWESLRRGAPMVLAGYSFLLSFSTVLIGLRYPSMPVKQQKTIFWCTVLAIAVTTVTTIVGLMYLPGVSRILATIQSSDDPRLIQAEWRNIGGFAFTYILLTVYPAIICYLKETKTTLVLKVIVAGVIGYYFLKAEYMTALLGYAILSTLWIMPKRMSAKNMIYTIVALFIIGMAARSTLTDIFKMGSANVESQVLAQRFDYLVNPDSDYQKKNKVGEREKALETSWNGFLRSPIIGNWHASGSVGGHSFILDFISTYGLLGVILLFWMYKRIYDVFYSHLRKTPYFGYAVASIITAILMSIVNTGDHWPELTLITPVIISMIGIRNEQKAKKRKKIAPVMTKLVQAETPASI